jgi:heme-degrading monooxygenase HmoA
MHTRVTRVEGQSDQVDQGIEQVKSNVLPALQAERGFKSLTLLVDRDKGTMLGISFWEDEQAVTDSEEATRSAREQAAETVGAGAPQVERFEVAFQTND